MKNEKKHDKASLLTASVIICLCIFFVGGFVLGLNNVLAMEGQYPPVENEEGIYPAPETAADAISLLNEAIKLSEEEDPALSTDVSFGIDSDSIKTDGSSCFSDALAFVRGDVESFLEDSIETPSTEFAAEIDDVLRNPGITASDVKDIECSYIYYCCSSCGKTSDEPLDKCDDCGCEEAYQLKYRDNYSVKIILNPTEAVLKNCFSPRSEAECTALADEALAGRAKLENLRIDYTGLSISYEVNRLTNQVSFIRYTKEMAVSSDTSFTGEWSEFTAGNVKFNLTENFTYSFTWPSLVLSEHYMSVEPGGDENLLATLTCDNPTDYTIKWTSSDENIVTVDDEGYFDAGKTPGKATITASFEFDGKTYSDECEIEVKISVDGLKMSPKKVTLAPGETKQLNVKVSPKKATIKTLKWYSTDESIATVDADGVVHAVSSGTVTAYCLSDDGYYKSTCEVTVK